MLRVLFNNEHAQVSVACISSIKLIPVMNKISNISLESKLFLLKCFQCPSQFCYPMRYPVLNFLWTKPS